MVGGSEGANASLDARRPGTGVRILLFLLSIAASGLLLAVGFPSGAPDRLPILLFSLALALYAAVRPTGAVAAFAFLFPCAGLLARLCGGTDPTTWPALLFGGLAAGWSFRFIYDFESVPEPARGDRTLRALLFLWVLSTILAVFRAATLWSVLHALSGRAVNGEGLRDGEAIRESLFSLSALAAGAIFYFLLRRSGRAARKNALNGALIGVTVSALAAGFQRLGLLPQETRAFWRLTNQMSGGAADPNALGLVCGLALLVALSDALSARTRSRFTPFVACAAVLGLLFSGSRSGLLLVVFGLLLLLFRGRLASPVRAWAAAALLAAVLLAALFFLRGSAGTLGGRLAQTFDPSLPIEYRVSARPLLWRAAGRLFLRHPIEGAGMGAFSWRFPDLMSEENRHLAMRDNPGSAVVQALAETGAIGFLLMGLFAVGLFSQAIRRARRPDSEPLSGGAAVAVASFLVALTVGSHWFSPEVSLFFFLLAAITASPRLSSEAEGKPETESSLSARGRLAAVILYSMATVAAILSTARAEEAFRFSPRIGFHDREVGPGGPFRWTERRFAVWLTPGQTLRMGLAHFTPEPGPVAIEAKTGGQIIYSRSLKPGQAVGLRLSGGRLPASVVFSLSRSFVPKSLGLSGDRRELGLLAVER